MSLFYKEDIVKIESVERLLEVPCPLCGGKLHKDPFISLRYSPDTLFFGVMFYMLMTITLCGLGWDSQVIQEFLGQFSYRMQNTIILCVTAIIAFPFAGLLILWELKLEYHSEDHVYLAGGVACKRCGNAFVAVIPLDDVADASESTSSENANNEGDIPKQ